MIGLDTVSLRLIDYQIATGFGLKITPAEWSGDGEVDDERFLFRAGEHDVRGIKAYFNAPNGRFNVTLKPLKHDPLATALMVQMSVPKHLTGNNYHPANEVTTKQALSTLEAALGEIGIKTNLNNAALSRIDLTRNLHTSLPFNAYSDVLRTLQGNRTNRREYGGECFLWENKQQEVSAYDKVREMLSQKRDVKGIPDTFRLEARLLKGPKVRTVTGFSSVNDLLEGFDSLPSVYEKTVRAQMFRYIAAERPIVTSDDYLNQMRYFYGKDRNWLEKWKAQVGMETVIERNDSDKVRDAIIELLGSRQKASMALAKLEKDKAEAAALKERSKHRTFGDLHRELETLAFQP